MTTYSQSQGKEIFDWNKFLEKDNYEFDEIIEAWRKATSWVTCACGNQCDIIPRNKNGAPDDEILFNLGLRFENQIWLMKNSKIFKDNAIRTLKMIEKRSQFLINEINKNK